MRYIIESSFKVDKNDVDPSFVEFKIKIDHASESRINAAPPRPKPNFFLRN